ncbi:Zn(II)2Cys6 transcription factor [Aspergillus lucknowensis]|uniref:Zn(2)-C6 fungal-type domain-containing protein n=1 Tax=Aspergillus lucknowensis TaxID=176173 RepID=A0ABR4M534_9EURO
MNPPKVTVKKACDGCKVRKIRCGGGHPCRPCLNARIQCTYIRVHQSRGPQKLRATTRSLIEETQRNEAVHISHTDCNNGTSPKRSPTHAIASLLYIYHVRMYPVWPVVHVDSLIASLQRDADGKDYETRALATAVAAATMAQLRLGKSCVSDRSITAETLASECLEARQSPGYRSIVNLNTVRTAFFLHVFYENQCPGGSESVLYLREAISLAQMMFLHQEVSYTGLDGDEQQIRRRVLWLLFVTERGVCILHKLPVVLKTDIAMPEANTHEEPKVLPAFLKLLALFRLFEKSNMFDIIGNSQFGYNETAHLTEFTDPSVYDILQDKFREGPSALDQVCDVQRADLCVTRHWMRMLTWKVLSAQSRRGYLSAQCSISPAYPLLVARDLVDAVCHLPRTALQAHGFGMQLKLLEIANSLADAVTMMSMLPEAPTWDQDARPSSVLARLHLILMAFKDGGNNALVEILYQKMAHAQLLSSSAVPPSLNGPGSAYRSRHDVHTVDGGFSRESQLRESASTPFSSQQSATADWAWQIRPDTASNTSDDPVDDNRKASKTDSNLPEAIISASLPQRDFDNSWAYIDPTHTHLGYTASQQLSARANTATPLLDQTSVDTVSNNFIFENSEIHLPLETFWTMGDLLQGDQQPAVPDLLT